MNDSPGIGILVGKQWQSGLNATEKDKRFYNLQRMPSYTDRILSKSLPGFVENVQMKCFESCERVLSSDHKPVRAFFELQTTLGWAAFESGISGPGVTAPRSKKPIRITISDISASDLAVMDVNGTSDPYVQVFSDPPELLHKSSRLITSVKRKNLNPNWGTETLSIVINSDDLECASANGHLFFSVWDEDQFIRDFSFDHDLIGLFCISLRPFIEHALQTPKPFRLKELLYNKGVLNGSLSFKVSVALPSIADEEIVSYDNLDSARPNGTCCTLS